MAFDFKWLTRVNQTISPFKAQNPAEGQATGGPTMWFYNASSTGSNETAATIEGANYFLGASGFFGVGDWIICDTNDPNYVILNVTAVTAGTTVTTAVYEPSGGGTGTFTTVSVGNGTAAAPSYTFTSDTSTGFYRVGASDIGASAGGTKVLDITATGTNAALSTSSATPGTIRALKGVMTGTNTTMTSGNLVGVRGEVDCVGASGGFLYGAQGKVIPTGTLSGSVWCAGVFGQLDLSNATINAGQTAPIWGDYGTTSGTLTNQTGCYGIAMTNTTAVVTIGQLYLYGGATNLMYLNTNAGLSGVTYFKDAGTGSGSWGNATPPTPSKVLTISVDGTTYYLPLVAQNT